MITQMRKRLVIGCTVATFAALILAASINYAFPTRNQIEGPKYPTELSTSDYGWNFTGSINSSSVVIGQAILLTVRLTNTATSNQTIEPFVIPLVNPGIYAQNGTLLWAWNPPEITQANMTLASGKSLSLQLLIPTARLQPGQTFLLKVVPLAFKLIYPKDFVLTFQFSTES